MPALLLAAPRDAVTAVDEQRAHLRRRERGVERPQQGRGARRHGCRRGGVAEGAVPVHAGCVDPLVGAGRAQVDPRLAEARGLAQAPLVPLQGDLPLGALAGGAHDERVRMDVPEGDPRDLPLGEALLEQVLVDAGEVPVRVGAERRPVDEAVAGGLHEQEVARRPVRARLARVEHEADDRREVGLGGVARVADQRLAAPVLIPRVERRRRRHAVGAVDGDAALPRHAFLDERAQHRGVAALARVLGAGVIRADQGGGGAVVAGGDAAQALPVVERADDRGDGGPVVGRLVARVGGRQGGRAVEVGVVEVEPVVDDADRHRGEPVGVLPGAVGADGLRPPVVAGGVVLDAAAVAPAVGVGARIRLAQQRPLDERHDDALGGGELLLHGDPVGEGGGHPDHRGEGAEAQCPGRGDRDERDAGAGAGADEEVESAAATAARHEIPLVIYDAADTRPL